MTAGWRGADRVWLAILGVALALRIAASFSPSFRKPDCGGTTANGPA